MKILACGLSGTGKTFISRILANQFNLKHYDADIVRKVLDDWNFTEEGRIRQAVRMRDLADSTKGNSICSFIAPTEEIRNIFNPDFILFCNRKPVRDFSDTTQMFEAPKFCDYIYDEETDIDDLIFYMSNKII